ncbi:N-acetylmuramoyl-L-alanine amidase [Virgibacillus subterraneus]|uniref:Autolysin n=1 Tax=Virgibacillus subterraneus TaxID=621109 RepID=A0A1H9EGJ2_9BACI|nr:peptidoglycan-binding protein [Virgibacillus subterraneus]SEQ24148.1 N-acetylmuramoyl-L-alanine amidase [Virgibacillus subterraneus]
MTFIFESLPQLIDKREGLPENGEYVDYGVSSKTIRAWHHSLTRKHLGGSDAEGFASYHVNNLGWPGIGYHFVIEPKNVINGRARIVWCHDPGKRSYHVGDSNTKSLGICVAGDYRYDDLDDATKASIDELHQALVDDGIGNTDKAHNELPGYGWKPCCVFDYNKAVHFLDGKQPEVLPGTYTIQEGDTFWGIANGLKEVSADDLIKANPDVDPKRLQVGQKISLGAAKKPNPEEPKQSSKLPNTVYRANKPYPHGSGVRAVQEALASIYFYPEKGAKNNGVDGYYGPNTADAVRRFQSMYGLKQDGVYGPNTRAKLLEVM